MYPNVSSQLTVVAKRRATFIALELLGPDLTFEAC